MNHEDGFPPHVSASCAASARKSRSRTSPTSKHLQDKALALFREPPDADRTASDFAIRPPNSSPFMFE